MKGWLLKLKRARKAQFAVPLVALWKLLRHPDTPRRVKVVAALVLAYALSPIDLIPDFIPVLGMLDDIILVPLGVALVVRLTPEHLWQARLREAESQMERLPRLAWGAVLVAVVWVALLVLLAYGLWVWVAPKG